MEEKKGITLWQRQTDRQLYNTNKDKMAWGKKSFLIKFEFSFGAKYIVVVLILYISSVDNNVII